MLRYFLAIFHAIIFLALFMGIPYVIGDWVHLFWSWMPALIVTISIAEETPDKL